MLLTVFSFTCKFLFTLLMLSTSASSSNLQKNLVDTRLLYCNQAACVLQIEVQIFLHAHMSSTLILITSLCSKTPNNNHNAAASTEPQRFLCLHSTTRCIGMAYLLLSLLAIIQFSPLKPTWTMIFQTTLLWLALALTITYHIISPLTAINVHYNVNSYGMFLQKWGHWTTTL